MTLHTNDDFANRELSIDELDTIAAGSILGWIGHEVSAGLHWLAGPGLRDAAIAITWIGKHLPPPVIYNAHKAP